MLSTAALRAHPPPHSRRHCRRTCIPLISGGSRILDQGGQILEIQAKTANTL